MLSKKVVVNALKECIQMEDDMSSIYNTNANSEIFLAGFSKIYQPRVKYMLSVLRKESEQHKKTYQELLTKIEESKKNAF